MAIHVFYANRHYATVSNMIEYAGLQLYADYELYNGAFMFEQPNPNKPGKWFRPDWTPVYPDDITEEMKGYLLLLGAF